VWYLTYKKLNDITSYFILGTQGIQHALETQKMSSSNDYVRDFRDKIIGKAPSDLEKSYPEYDFARTVSKMASKVCMNTGTIFCSIDDLSFDDEWV